VRDSGIGLRQDQIDHLFSAFKQADDSITRRYGGTGLGLSICKQLAKLMGGRIWAESVEGVGSEFIFTARLQLTKGSRARKRRYRDKLKEIRALVVDDNEAARDVLSSMLRSLKIEVLTANNGESAIALLEQATQQGRPYDVVLLDWIMPGIDGIETARRIKANAAIAKVPAMLMVTANGRDEAYIEAERVGMNGFLLKPVYASVMYNTLLDIVGIGAISGPHTVQDEDRQPDLAILAGSHILLVDDNSFNQEVAAEFLRSAGMAATIVSNGRECIEALDKNAYDLVLMDIQMPEMDGLEATRRIRKDERFKDLPILAMTAHAMTGDREKSLAAGMNDHITKPIDQLELYQCLIKWLSSRQPGGRPAPREEPGSFSAYNIVLPPLSGIDQVGALKALDNNTRLFAKMLYDFKKRYSPLPASLRELSTAGNWKEIEKKAHTVKGIAGYIGSSSLMKAAHSLEDALNNDRIEEGRDFLAAFVDVLEHILASLQKLPAITEVIPVREVPGSAGAADKDEVAGLIQVLIGQLKRGEATAEEQFATIRNILEGCGFDEQLQGIAALIDDIEYDQAAESVGTLLKLLDREGES
jgi:two-component system, sensor histidine kinase and response regulator